MKRIECNLFLLFVGMAVNGYSLRKKVSLISIDKIFYTMTVWIWAKKAEIVEHGIFFKNKSAVKEPMQSFLFMWDTIMFDHHQALLDERGFRWPINFAGKTARVRK